MKLVYNQPAESWNEALPIGNGYLGGMVFGGIAKERVGLNEDSIWYGNKIDRNNPDALKNLKKIQQLIFEGRQGEADPLILGALSGIPDNQRRFEPAGDLIIETTTEDVKDYKRTLNLEEAIVTVSYLSEGVSYTREYLTSYPEHIMCVHLKASKKEKLNFRFRSTRGRGLVDKIERKAGCTFLTGSTAKDSIEFQVGLSVTTDGKVGQLGEFITVKEASVATIYVAIETTFRTKNLHETVLKRLNKAVKKGYESIKKEHILDYQKLYQRMTFQLTNQKENPEEGNTFDWWQEVQNGNFIHEKELTEILFQYGRYLLIASSRKGSLPANLQGVWNQDYIPSWDSKYTININTEMNYWICEKGNLNECHQPLFDLLEKMYPNGKETAKQMYGARGFVCHHNTDIYGDTAPQTYSLTSGYWAMGAAWLALHLYQHHYYTLDQDFLEKYFYLIEEAALFFVDYTVTSPEGYLVTNPSLSPENSFYNEKGRISSITYGPTMDNEILRDLCQVYLESAQILKKGSYLKEVTHLLEKLPPLQLTKEGTVMEWIKDYQEVEPGHRHVSHLYGLFPSQQISKKTPLLYEGARKTLEKRLKNGGGHTGWSAAWIINLFAQLDDGPACLENIRKFMKQSLYPNLLDSHPPFQIDGNFGFSSAIIEMLVQQKGEDLYLLPALPKTWESGKVKGICLPYNQQIDLTWKDFELKKVVIYGDSGSIHHIWNKNSEVDRSIVQFIR